MQPPLSSPSMAVGRPAARGPAALAAACSRWGAGRAWAPGLAPLGCRICPAAFDRRRPRAPRLRAQPQTANGPMYIEKCGSQHLARATNRLDRLSGAAATGARAGGREAQSPPRRRRWGLSRLPGRQLQMGLGARGGVAPNAWPGPRIASIPCQGQIGLPAAARRLDQLLAAVAQGSRLSGPDSEGSTDGPGRHRQFLAPLYHLAVNALFILAVSNLFYNN